MTDSNRLNIKTIIIIVLAIIVVILLGLYGKKSYDLTLAEQNYYAAIDTLTVTKNKANENVYEKTEYILEVDRLKKENSDLYNAVSKLKSLDKKNLVEIATLKTEINFLKDSVQQTIDTTYNSEGTKFLFSFNNEYRKLNGYTLVYENPLASSLHIEEDQITADLTITKTQTDKGFKIGVSSNNPYLKINDINGSIVNIDAYQKSQKQKHWGLGVGLGLGITGGWGATFNNGITTGTSIVVGPTVSIVATYNFLIW